MAEDWKSTLEWRIENLKGAIRLADSTIRSLILTNGAAGAGLLTFIGDSKQTSEHLRWALVSFGGGVFFAVICSLLAYVTQRTVATLETNRVEMPLACAALLAAVVSAMLFALGLILAAAGLR